MFKELEGVNARPAPFECYTARELWTDRHTSERMLEFHLNGDIDVSSRKAEFIERSVDWIISRFKVGRGFKIADFGCGPGLYTTQLAQKSEAKVTGIDFSQRSIRHAETTAAGLNLPVLYVNEDYLEFETDERFDLILMIMCDFCALGPRQRATMLRKFQTLLKPDGRVLLDVYSLNAFEQRKETAIYEVNLLDGFWSPKRYYGFLNTFRYDREKVVLDKYTIVEADRTRTICNWLQYFSPDMLESEFMEHGFAVEELLSDVAGSPFREDGMEFAVVAGRP